MAGALHDVRIRHADRVQIRDAKMPQIMETEVRKTGTAQGAVKHIGDLTGGELRHITLGVDQIDDLLIQRKTAIRRERLRSLDLRAAVTIQDDGAVDVDHVSVKIIRIF